MKLRAAALRLTLALLLFAPALGAADKPSLVLVISVDQMRADYLDRFRPWFGDDGFKRFLERGAVFPRAAQRHATTFTAPGHASIGSGLDPRDHGIIGNRWFDTTSGTSIYCTEDPDVAFVPPPAAGQAPPWKAASPGLTTSVFLGDRLKQKFPRARVLGVALKDRAAVLMAGRKADAAIWFEEKNSRFVTSTYYPPHPELLAINDTLPAFFAAHRTWELSGRIPPAALDAATFDPPELSAAKNPPAGFGATFPHPLTTPKAVVASPFGNELVLALARSAIEKWSLGSRAGEPDLLFIGLSSTDYIGHAFGPDSKEIADGIVRLDATLQAFFGWLDRRVGKGRSMAFLTADHGVTPLPEVARAKYRQRTGKDDPTVAGRVNLDNRGGDAGKVSEDSDERLAIELAVAKRFGYPLDESAANFHEGAVLFFEEPGLYLNKATLARRGAPIEAVKEAIRDLVRAMPGVETAYTNTEIADGLPPDAPHALAVARSFRADRSGDLFVLLKPGWMWSYGREAGTTHGQPNDDDARVPLAVWGPGVAAGSYDTPTSPLAIARTVAALYGFEAGEPDVPPLQPVLAGAASLAAAPR
ncbi:MAG TPA: alkaline phosphatase family protein [Thermoanaerobaculia bacterium]|nr:alkaline phosphatase family protein [Thermoanaerobaculia bacterium]